MKIQTGDKIKINFGRRGKESWNSLGEEHFSNCFQDTNTLCDYSASPWEWIGRINDRDLLKYWKPTRGIEPPTRALRMRCSTNWATSASDQSSLKQSKNARGVSNVKPVSSTPYSRECYAALVFLITFLCNQYGTFSFQEIYSVGAAADSSSL